MYLNFFVIKKNQILIINENKARKLIERFFSKQITAKLNDIEKAIYLQAY